MKLGKIIILNTSLTLMDDTDIMRQHRAIAFDVDNIWSMIRMVQPAKKRLANIKQTAISNIKNIL